MIPKSTIIRCGRALVTALAPITGERAAGIVRMRALPGKQFVLPRYTYLFPIISDAAFTSWLFKVDEGPGEDGGWIIGDDQDTLVSVYSAIGGEKYNVPESTTFAFDLKVDSLAFAPYAAAAFEGGQNGDDQTSLYDAVAYDAFDGPVVSVDNVQGAITHFPAAFVAFQSMVPADGVTTAQTNQGSVNAGTGTKFYKVTYTISILTSRTHGDVSRRFINSLIVDRVLEELVDRHAADDGDPLSSPSGIQINQVVREAGNQSIYKQFHINTIQVSLHLAISKKERRTFVNWLRTRMDVDHPQTPVELPNQGTMRVVDGVIIDMNDATDITLDGVFTRASDASFWDGETLRVYEPGERRIVNGRLLMEPAVENPLGDASTDFTEWTVFGGATISEAATLAPDESLADAIDTVDTDPVLNGVKLEDQVAAMGVPQVFSVWVRTDPGVEQAFMLVAMDGVSEHSQEFTANDEWKRFYFEFIPDSAEVELRIVSAEVGSLHVWGAVFDVNARWGAEFATDKAPDVLTFLPCGDGPVEPNRTPLQVLKGRWTVYLRTPDHVPCDLTGAGLTQSPVVVSINDGATDLLLVTLAGTPASGGALLTLQTRGGNLMALEGVEWTPGSVLEFHLDALGELRLGGTNTHDGVYPFPRYDVRAVLTADRLVFGSDASGNRKAVPGFFSVVVGT